jgi:hypothetical protein
MLDFLNQPSFLTLRPLHMGKLTPIIILLSYVVEAGLQPKKGLKFMQSDSRGFGPASKVETPYHDNDLILTPIISPQSRW